MTAAATNPTPSPLAQPAATLRGVGRERAAQLARLNIFTIEDLLLHRPRRYEDRSRFLPVAELRLDKPATTRGTVVALGVKWYRRREKSVFELILDDGTARLHCRWWNLPFMEKYFAVGDEVVVFGKPLALKPRTMDHPETEIVEGGEDTFIHLNRITPVYPLTEGLPQRWLRSLIWRTLQQLEAQIVEPWQGKLQFADSHPFPASLLPVHETRIPLTPSLSPAGGGEGGLPPGEEVLQSVEKNALRARSSQGLTTSPKRTHPSRANAIHMLHFPEAADDVEIARRRLALDEFVQLQLQIQLRRKKFEAQAQALPCGGDNRLIKPLLAVLGFKLTGAQTRVLREIRADMRGPHPMRRLLQGDVGSGKTVVAACSTLMAIESGFDVALMAPTEILAEQHFRNFNRWFEPLGVRVALRTGGKKTSNSDKSRAGAEHQTPNTQRDSDPASRIPHPASLFIGTHALLEDTVAIERLGLAIIDEQHKFGVAQREQLVRKGRYPHLLVMTATPIPRTLGLTVYGELDVSVIDESPPGRGRVKTFVRTADKLPKVWAFVREKLAEGRQAYVVYPRVEETERNEVKAVTKEFENVKRLLAPYRAGLLQGRLKSGEKEEVMAAFCAGSMQVLLATSLIEVGVDVPNATVMLIENAERFGLAQLHQLRGRIGRGAHDSYCILVSPAANAVARQRLAVLEETTDGFRIAEADLKLRGPGELLGRLQSGAPDFRFGSLSEDWELIRLARQLAMELARA